MANKIQPLPGKNIDPIIRVHMTDTFLTHQQIIHRLKEKIFNISNKIIIRMEQ